eukprot:TRINITY_DN10960_c0_g1_i1.p2 TRINITY_DN10960_c0_g1~~TRINITY_DN10960_c0_g1_i1.p2  ORF type:complete len:525 (+),score=126.97 TRINITY_DN10960_c0_g1_i1:101-1576(+)
MSAARPGFSGLGERKRRPDPEAEGGALKRQRASFGTAFVNGVVPDAEPPFVPLGTGAARPLRRIVRAAPAGPRYRTLPAAAPPPTPAKHSRHDLYPCQWCAKRFVASSLESHLQRCTQDPERRRLEQRKELNQRAKHHAGWERARALMGNPERRAALLQQAEPPKRETGWEPPKRETGWEQPRPHAEESPWQQEQRVPKRSHERSEPAEPPHQPPAAVAPPHRVASRTLSPMQPAPSAPSPGAACWTGRSPRTLRRLKEETKVEMRKAKAVYDEVCRKDALLDQELAAALAHTDHSGRQAEPDVSAPQEMPAVPPQPSPPRQPVSRASLSPAPRAPPPPPVSPEMRGPGDSPPPALLGPRPPAPFTPRGPRGRSSDASSRDPFVLSSMISPGADETNWLMKPNPALAPAGRAPCQGLETRADTQVAPQGDGGESPKPRRFSSGDADVRAPRHSSRLDQLRYIRKTRGRRTGGPDPLAAKFIQLMDEVEGAS